MSKKLFLVIFIVSIFFILSAVEGFAAVPQKMNFQGRLMKITGGGTPTPETGGKTVAFTIYDDPISSLTASWQDLTHQVSCDSQGQFSTVLDFSTGQNPSHPLDFSQPLYLQVNYDGKDLNPRQPLETVPYAFYAVSAETANLAHTAESVIGSTPAGGWTSSTGKVVLTTITNNVGIGTTEPGEKLSVINKVNIANIPSGYVASITNANNTTGKYGLVVGTNWLAAENFIANFGNYNASSGGVFTSYMAIKGNGYVSIGTAEPTYGPLTVYKNSPNGGTAGSVIHINNPDTGGAGDSGIVYTIPAQTWYAGVDNSNNDNFRIAPSTDPSLTTAGLTVVPNGNVGIGTSAPSTTLEVAGTIYSSGSQSPFTTGGWARNLQLQHAGAIVWKKGAGTRAWGIGKTYSGAEDIFYIFTSTTEGNDLAPNYLYTFTEGGNFYCKGSKFFSIDHPTKSGYKLQHACMEGPEAGVYYRGESNLTNGMKTVSLPDYFEALTRKDNRTVLITPVFENIGDPVSNLSVSTVRDGKFTVKAIDSNNPNQKFFWEVKAVRADIPPLEVEKLAIEK